MMASTMHDATVYKHRGSVLPLAPYQRVWMHMMQLALEGNYFSICWLAARHAAKSWTTATFLARWAAKHRLQITLVPGGKQEQGNEFARYFRLAVPQRLRDRKRWSATCMQLRNGSRLLVVAPTEGGVESSRADVMVFEEAQLLDAGIHGMALPQAGAKGTVLIYIGTSKKPSVLNDVYDAMPEKQRLCTKWEDVVAAGILEYNALMEIKKRMTLEQWSEFYECVWVDRASYRFQLLLYTAPMIVDTTATGVDPNANPGYAWVRVARDNKGRFIAIQEGVFKRLEDIGKTGETAKIMLESNGPQCLIAAEANKYSKIVQADPWGEGTKQDAVDNAKVLNERGSLYVITNACPNLEKGLKELVFTAEGRIDKAHSGDQMHYVDAWLHALKGLATSDRAIAGSKITKMNLNR